MEVIYILQRELDELPDYTVSQPKVVPIGMRWKIFSQGDIFVGERVSESKAILKLAVVVDEK